MSLSFPDRSVEMFAPKVGKQGTKGGKLIHEDNISTVSFYLKWCVVSTAISSLICLLPLFTCSYWDYFWCAFFTIANFSSWYFMNYIGKPQFSPEGTLLHPGKNVSLITSFSPASCSFQIQAVTSTAPEVWGTP